MSCVCFSLAPGLQGDLVNHWTLRLSSLLALTRKGGECEDEVLRSVPCCDGIQPEGASEGWHRNVV